MSKCDIGQLKGGWPQGDCENLGAFELFFSHFILHTMIAIYFYLPRKNKLKLPPVIERKVWVSLFYSQLKRAPEKVNTITIQLFQNLLKGYMVGTTYDVAKIGK